MSGLDGTGTSSWSYDAEGRVTALVQPQGTTTREYDSWGRMTKLSQGSGNDINYAYTLHRLTSTTKMPENEVTGFVYDSYDRMNRQNNSNGTYTEYGFDALDRQNSIVHKNSSGTVISSESYSYDVIGNLTSKLVDGVTTSFSYDAIDQLLSEVRSGYAASYTYDNNGNRLTRVLNGTTENYSYDAGDKLLSVAIGGSTTKSFSYDARGNTTAITISSGTQSFSYNAEDKPISITAPGFSQTNAFNGAGARTSKVVNGSSTTFKRSSPGVTAPLLAAGSSTFNPGISEKQGGVTHTQISDRLGTLKGTTNSSETVTSTKQFDAFGNLTSSSGIASLKGFVAYYGYQEDENGLKQVGHRLYDPSMGRFLTRDPIRDGLNWMAYCGNCPTGLADPSGLRALIIVCDGKPGEVTLVNELLARRLFSWGDYIVGYYLTKEQILPLLDNSEIDEVVIIGHGSNSGGVVLHYGKDGKPKDYFTGADLIGARKKQKRLRWLRLEACSQLCLKIGESWANSADSILGYDVVTDTFGAIFKFDPPWGGSGHIKPYPKRGGARPLDKKELK